MGSFRAGIAAVILGALALSAPAPAADTAGDDVAQHAFLRDKRGVFTTIDPPQVPPRKAAAISINDRGETAGFYVDRRDRAHGFLRDRKGRFRTIDAPGASEVNNSLLVNLPGTQVGGISDLGQVTGFYTGASGTARGFLMDRRGEFTTIEVPGASETLAGGINDHGQIVVVSVDAGGAVSGYLRNRNGRLIPIEAPGAVQTLPIDVNKRGQIVGVYVDADGTSHGFVRTARGRFTTIAVPGATVTLPSGISDRGKIVGEYRDGATLAEGHAFLLDKNGGFTTLVNPAARAGTAASDINNRGEIVGAYDLGLIRSGGSS
jgi:uncharacterized membrane protein